MNNPHLVRWVLSCASFRLSAAFGISTINRSITMGDHYRNAIPPTDAINAAVYQAPAIAENDERTLQDIVNASREVKERNDAAVATASYRLRPQVTEIDVAKSELRRHEVLAAHASPTALVEILQGLQTTVQGLATKVQGLQTTVEGLQTTVEANREARFFNRRKLSFSGYAGQYIAIQKCSSNPTFAQRINQIPNQEHVLQIAGDLFASPAFFPSTVVQMNTLDARGVIRLMKYYESTFGIDQTTPTAEYAQYFKDWISS